MAGVPERPKMPGRKLHTDEEWGSGLEVALTEADDLYDILARIQIFDLLTGEEIRKVERLVHRRAYVPQETIVRQGTPGAGIYIIESGSADVLLETGRDREIRLATLTEGQFFGEMSLLDGAPRAASVTAVEATRVIGFFSPDLMDLIEQSPGLGFKIVLRTSQLMSDRLRATLGDYRCAVGELRKLEADRQEEVSGPDGSGTAIQKGP